jgi:hypothetical protein
MSGKYYMLINPYIEGDANKVFKAINSLEASKMAYEEISKYFNNSVHNFRFSLLKLKSDSVDEQNLKPNKFNLLQYGGGIENNKFNANNFSHFEVSEKITKNGEVDYSIKKYNGTINNIEHLVKNIMEIQNKLKSKKNKKMSESSDSTDQSGSGSEESDSSDKQHGGNISSSSDSYQIGGDNNINSSSDSYQIGGGNDKKSNYDEDDDDSPDYYVKKNYIYDPIYYWYYYPSLYSIDRLFLPTFVSPLSPTYVLDLLPTTLNPSVTVTY